jgi:hypothetical protein
MYDWSRIQELYDQGNSYNDLVKLLGLGSMTPLMRGAKQGLLKPRSHSDATKNHADKHGTKPLSIEHKALISNSVRNRVKQGNWHFSFSKTRTHAYTSKFAGDVRLYGMWELKFAQYLDANNIRWRRPHESFYYEYAGLKKGFGHYTPDFYLIDDDLWIEIKGYEHDRDRAKWKWFPHKLKVLKGEELLTVYKLDIQTK